MKLRKTCVLVIPGGKVLTDGSGRAFTFDCEVARKTIKKMGKTKLRVREI